MRCFFESRGAAEPCGIFKNRPSDRSIELHVRRQQKARRMAGFFVTALLRRQGAVLQA
jgi:hypothetical protein